MRKYKLKNKKRFMLFLFIVICIIFGICLMVDFVRYPECYITTWKQQLQNDILNKNEKAILLYENTYVTNNRDLFKDDFALRNTYLSSEQPQDTGNSDCAVTFIITAYCKENYPHICNNGHSTHTATGTISTVGRTIAVDPNIIPYGTVVNIDGIGYRTAEDCGGAIIGNHIDLLVDTHQEALEFGTQYRKVTVYE